MEGMIESFNVAKLKPIREMIYDTIRAAIFSGELKPGDRLREEELASRMQVSRTPIREALRKLEAEGLIKHLPRKGAVVREFTQHEVMELYSIRIALEALAISQVVRNITAREIEDLRGMLLEMRRFTDLGDSPALFIVTRKFNMLMLGACRMPLLIKLISNYQEYLERVRTRTMESQTRKEAAQRDHEEIFAAVAAANAEAAEQAVKRHLMGAMQACLKTLSAEEITAQ